MASVRLDMSQTGRELTTVGGDMSQRLGTSDEAIGTPSVPPSSANYSRTRSGGMYLQSDSQSYILSGGPI